MSITPVQLNPRVINKKVYPGKCVPRLDHYQTVNPIFTKVIEVSRPQIAQVGNVHSLINTLQNSQSSRNRSNAAFALGKLGAAAARWSVPALLQALKTDRHSGVRLYSAMALGDIGPAAKPAIPALINMLLTIVPEAAIEVARALGKIGTPVKPYVKNLLNALKDPKFQSPRWQVRLNIIRAFRYLGPVANAAEHTLINIRQQANLAKIRQAAVAALGTVGTSQRAAKSLAASLRSDPSTDVREEAARSLIIMGRKAKAAVSELSAALLYDQDHGVRQLSAVALGKIGHKTSKVMAALKKALSDPITPVKIRAAIAMYKLDPLTRNLVLRTVISISRQRSATARTYALTALEKIGEPQAIARLKQMRADPDPFIADEATEAVKKLQKKRSP